MITNNWKYWEFWIYWGSEIFCWGIEEFSGQIREFQNLLFSFKKIFPQSSYSNLIWLPAQKNSYWLMRKQKCINLHLIKAAN